MTGPESVVLPLHHTPIYVRSLVTDLFETDFSNRFPITAAKVGVIFERAKCFGTFFLIISDVTCLLRLKGIVYA